MGQRVDFKTPDEGKEAGIIMVFQELSLIRDLTVAENMFLGSLPHKGFAVDWKKLNDDASAALDELNSSVRGTDNAARQDDSRPLSAAYHRLSSALFYVSAQRLIHIY